ncbi:MAG: cytochrome c oxidase accessory protein CcoG [Pseudomonadota bacterium]
MDAVAGNKPGSVETTERIEVEAVNKKENRELYAARKRIHPKRARGTFRVFKWWVMLVTLGIYYITPWLRWDRGPFAPDQAVLIDLPNRRFYFFFIEVWPQEFFYIAGLLVMAGIGLFLVTSSVGRAWCGYTCPQTVWVDLYLVVERFIEGDRNQRIKLDAEPMSRDKIIKRVSKHTIWLLIGVATGGAWIFYFADAPTLLYQFVTLDAPFVAYATVAILTATTYVFGGLMREQVCTYMCPWPRVQGAMLDEHSLIVNYNDWRGEERSIHRKKNLTEGKPVGDCVDCNQCVAVCPMGIDIRDGQQLECITCALCIDACDSVMDKLGLERGLISYSTLSEYNHNMAFAGAERVERDGDTVWDNSTIKPSKVRPDGGPLARGISKTTLKSILRLRTLIYFLIYGFIGIALLTVLFTRDRLDVNVSSDRNPLFVKLSSGAIRNGYEVKIRNMKAEPRRFAVTVEGLGLVTTQLAGESGAQGETFYVDVDPDETHSMQVYVRKHADLITSTQKTFRFVVQEIGGKERAFKKAFFHAPEDSVNPN